MQYTNTAASIFRRARDKQEEKPPPTITMSVY